MRAVAGDDEIADPVEPRAIGEQHHRDAGHRRGTRERGEIGGGDRLYCNWGLRDAHAALRPGGVLAIWSAYRDDGFVARLEAVGFTVEETTVPDSGNATRSPYTIWLAGKAA